MKTLRLQLALQVSLVLFLSCHSTTQAQKQQLPNVIYILVDDLGYGDLNLDIDGVNVFRNPYIKTPKLAKLAGESLVFTHHYAASPVCSPSRAGLLTGRAPTRSNIHRWIEDSKFDGEEYLRSEEITIAEKILEAGYQTAIYGKWHLNCADWRLKENWRASEGTFPSQQGFHLGMVSKENPHLTTYQNSNSQKNPGDFYDLDGNLHGTIKGYTSQIIADSAMAFLKNRDQSKPFFLFLPFDAPHERIYNPDEYDAMYETGDPNKDVYYANITYLDHQIGRILDRLEVLGLKENTLIFFSSDHGPEINRAYYGAWRSYGTAYPLYGAKRTLYEGGIRVPGIVRWPGMIKTGVSTEANTTLDIMPTICELIGVALPEGYENDGSSILGHLLNGNPINRKQPLYWQYDYPESKQVVGKGYDSRFDGTLRDSLTYRPGVVIRQGNYVLRGVFKGKFELPEEFLLFDVVNDPEEIQELSDSMPELFKSLVDQLQAIHQSVNKDRLSVR